jgi:hypothetical protein
VENIKKAAAILTFSLEKKLLNFIV